MYWAFPNAAPVNNISPMASLKRSIPSSWESAKTARIPSLVAISANQSLFFVLVLISLQGAMDLNPEAFLDQDELQG